MSTLKWTMTAVMFFLYHAAALAYKYTRNGSVADTVILSENYPNSYNQHSNITWEWNVKSGKWGVVFLDFHLDSGSDSIGSYDWLKIDDRRRPSMTYRSDVPPVLPYISEGPQMIINFVSDGISNPRTTGFKLRILYGANERELLLKIDEERKHGIGTTEMGAFKYIRNSVGADTVILSENYPNSYNQHSNITWEWNMKSGRWGVVFQDFHLDSGSESIDSYDWLKIDDRRRPSVTYRSDVPPVLPYISEGPQMIINFVSDGISNPSTTGFKLRILYGANERELHLKIHEASKQGKETTEDNPNQFLIIAIASLAVFAVVIAVVVVILVRRNNRAKAGENRNVFGVRRNSGRSHSRRSSPSEEHPTNEQLSQPQPQQRRSERSVQRSNSQLNWMARAELTTTIQVSGCTPQPNTYTCSDTLTNVGAASPKVLSTTSRKNATSYGPNTHLRVDHATRSYESSLNEYSDTVDSLYHLQETEQGMHGDDMLDCGLPSYEEAFSNAMASRCSEENGPNSSWNCYQNAFPGKLLPENETNIYINTGPTSGTNGSIKGIIIDNSKCIIQSTCSDNLEAICKSPAIADKHDANMIVYQNCLANPGKKDILASKSSVQFVDGYAFIVPSSTSQDDTSQA